MSIHKHIHFIGIGGISMSAIAMIMFNKGYKISGSDCTKSAITEKLEQLGIKIYIGHKKENIKNPDLVVYTAAISKNNPELLEAKALNIRCLERADFLSELIFDYKYPIAISGTHGKTTTTSMVSCIFLHAGYDPTILVGGLLNKIGGNVQIGKGKHLIFEACEYKDSFLKYNPKIAIILNVDADHLDYFSGLEQIKESFSRFLDKLPKDGFAIINKDDENLMSAAEKAGCKKITYGRKNADYKFCNIGFSNLGHPYFDIYHQDKFLGKIHLQVVGEHNISNATGAFALAHTMGIKTENIIKGLESFEGISRRFEFKGKKDGVIIYDDYAHHPAEITATLKASNKIPHNKIWCIFQPHTYSRTKALANDFAAALMNVDYVIITDIYAARERKDPTVHASDISKKLSNAIYISSFEEIAKLVRKKAKSGDIVITMGAGDIYKVGEMLLK